MSTAHVRLEDVFTHTDDIGIVVSETFHQYPPGTDNQQVSLHVELAPSYGDLTAESVKQLDEKLKVALSYTLHALADIPANQRKWKKVLSTMLQSPVLEADDDLHRSESRILPSKSRVAQLDRTQDAAVVEEVKAWFQNLIGDEDIRQTTKIDIQKMAGIVAGKGATTRKLRHLIRHTEWDSKIQIDIGVLRFPDISNPHFKAYHIELRAWSQCSRTLLSQTDSSGITGDFRCCKFRPRREIIEQMTRESKEQAIREAESIFASDSATRE